jgi:hypothetical protein
MHVRTKAFDTDLLDAISDGAIQRIWSVPFWVHVALARYL